jgi:hypothetical protein
VLLFKQSALDRFGHAELALAVFVTGMPLGKQTLAAKELANGESLGGCSHLQHDSSSALKRQCLDLNSADERG